MIPYLDLLRHVLERGRPTPTRAILASTGETVSALSVFGVAARHDLADGFPLVTTRRIPFRAVAHELIWVLSGSTNVAYLRANGVTIWDEWAGADGEIGPSYGRQWRDFGGVDQVANLVRDLAAVVGDPGHPAARRLILTAWNPADIGAMALPPCHLLAQFRVADGRLDCQLYQRSADLFLGVPFNVASYALLTAMFARSASLSPGVLTHVIGDAHVYANHIDQAREQAGRVPLPLPRLGFREGSPLHPAEIRIGHLELSGYRHRGILRGEVAV